MFQQPPQQIIQNQQRKEHQQFISAENQAREKLNHYVYEYLIHIGAIKSADVFKSEVLGQTSNGNTNLQIDSPAPGFLFNWFSVFWDLYSAHPDKKDKAEPSNDAKSYHKMMFPACQFPEGIVNGGMFGPPGFPNPNVPNMSGHLQPDGMFPAAFFGGPRMVVQPGSSQSNQASPIPGGPSSRYSQQATRSGAPTPVGIGNNFPSTGHSQAQINTLAMNDQQMRFIQQQRQAAAVQHGRLAMNLPPAGPHGKQIRPHYGNPYMGSPSGTPPFSNQNAHNGGTLMSPNAAMAGQIPMTSSSGPIIQQQNNGGPIGQEAARFMMASGNIQSQFINHHEAPGSTGTSNAGPGSVSAAINTAGGNGNIGIVNAQEGEVIANNSGNETGPNSQLHSLLNGTTDMPMEMKQSPVFSGNQQSAGGVNGGTPINATAGISIGSNAGAGPGSVHSQCSGTNNQQHQGGQTLQTTPISESIEMGLGTHQSDEISKIKANLLEGFANQ